MPIRPRPARRDAPGRKPPRLAAVWCALSLGLQLPGLPGLPTAHAATVYLEDSPAAQELVEEAESLQTQGRLGEAVDLLQRVIEDYGNKLMATDEAAYTDALRWVGDRINRDPVLAAAYRERFAHEARRLLDHALTPAADASALAQVAQRYALTEAGLKATLALAGLRLEEADAAGAAALLRSLETHPDFALHAAAAHRLTAWAAGMAGEADAVTAALVRLEAVAPDQAHATREELAALLEHHARIVGHAAPPHDPPPLERPLWEIDLATDRSPQDTASHGQTVHVFELDDPGAAARIHVNVARSPGRMPAANQPTPTLRPVATEQMLVVSDNERVIAVDRTSGRVRWVYDHEMPTIEGQRYNLAGFGRVTLDERAVLHHGDAIYAVMGHTVPWQGRRAQLAPPTQLVCLDAQTGSLRWAVATGDLDEGIGRASFHGTPVACDGQIIAMARRSQVSSFQDSYLLSIDAHAGTLRWRRHLGSTSGGINRGGASPLSRMTLMGERIYFCDNQGTAAALDARTGTVRWLRVLTTQSADARGRPSADISPFSDTASPTMSRAGLILPLETEQGRGLLLDPEDGSILRTFNTQSGMARADDLMALPGGDILAIGPTVLRLDGDTFQQRWAFQPPRAASGSPGPAHITVLGPRAIYSSGTPGSPRLDEIDLETGESVRHHPVPWAGPVLALGDAWIVTSGTRMGSYLDWPSAYAKLKQQAADRPGSPEPGLNMAMLALSAGRADAVGEGVDLAMTALAHADTRQGRAADARREARKRVFDELLTLTHRTRDIDPAVIEAIFDRLAATTDNPGELVAYNLGRGAFLERTGRLEQAVEYYQAVLLDPQLAARPADQAGAVRRGEVAARQRLFALVEAHGPRVYENFERRATLELASIPPGGRDALNELLALAQRYPLAEAAAEALFLAARRQAQSPAHAAAVTQFRRAYQMTAADDLRRRAAASLADYYQQQGRPDAAIRWLELVARDHPGLRLPRGDQLVAPADWIATLRQGHATPPTRPRLTPPLGQPLTLAGTPLPHVSTVSDDTLTTREVILSSGRGARPAAGKTYQLSLYTLPETTPRWTVPAPPGDPHLVDQDDHHALLWSAAAGTIHALSTRDGSPLWPAVEVLPLLREVGDHGLAERRRATAGDVLDVVEGDAALLRQVRGEVTPDRTDQPPRVVAGESVVCVIDGRGRAVGLDRYTGRALWHFAMPMDAVTHAALIDDVLAVAGVTAPDTESASSMVVVLDLVTGRPRFPGIEDRDPVQWLGAAPGGDPLLLTQTQLTRHDRRDGQLLWRLTLGHPVADPAVTLSDDILYISGESRLLAVDLASAALLAAAPDLPGRTDGVGFNGRLIALSPDGATALNPDLSTAWRDAIHLQPKRLTTQRLGERHVALLAQPPGGGLDTIHLYLLDADTGRIVAELVTPPGRVGSTPVTVRLLENHLLLAARGQTLIIPGSP